MNISRSLKGIAASVIIAFIGSCGGGGGSTDDGFKFSFDGVQEDDAVRSMELGTCSVFNISYQGQLMTISGVALKDLNEVEFTNNSGGTVEYTGTEGTYCSPAVSPGKDVYLHVTIGTNPPAVAIFTIQLPSDGSACTTSIDCQAGGDANQLCHYGICRTFAAVGVNLSETCESRSDCSGGDDVCIPAAYDSCQGYCTNVITFLTGDSVPASEEACSAVNGGWAEINELDGAYACIPYDLILCNGGEHDDTNNYSIGNMGAMEGAGGESYLYLSTTDPGNPLDMDAITDPCNRAFLRVTIMNSGSGATPCLDHNSEAKCIGIGVGESGGPEDGVAVTTVVENPDGTTYMFINGRDLLEIMQMLGASDGGIIRFMYWSEFDEANDPTEKTENYMVQVNFDNIDMCDL